jgi:hypothetical protein
MKGGLAYIKQLATLGEVSMKNNSINKILSKRNKIKYNNII